MSSSWKSRLIGVSLVLFTCVAIGASQVNQCESINTDIISTFANGLGCPSPVGICTTGNITSGLLRGTTRFVALTLIPGPGPSTLAYSGTLSITTDQGTLNISDVGVLDQTNNVFSEIDRIDPRIESSTGIFSGAKGILFISGNQTLTGFTGKVTGNLCLQSEQ